MKIRSLLLGSIAAAGLSTAGYAADLGVVTSLDICDELGISGLTISSDDNCLVITGEVKVEYKWGDYDPGVVYSDFDRSGDNYEVDNAEGEAPPALSLVSLREFECSDDQCNFGAGAGVYVADEQHLILYATPHWLHDGNQLYNFNEYSYP